MMSDEEIPQSVMSLSETKRINEENNDLRSENTQFKRSMKEKEERIGDLFDKLAGAMQRIAELEEAVKQKDTRIDEIATKLVDSMTQIEALEIALKKTSFISAKDVTTESQISIDNSKYRILLATRTVPVSVTQTGEYLIYSDPIKRILELRKPSPKP